MTLSFASADEYDLGYASLPPPDCPPLSSAVEWLSLDYHHDVHHDPPLVSLAQLRAKSLASFTVVFTGGRNACVEVLRARFGTPRPLRNSGRDYQAFGPFYVADGPHQRFSLSWYATLPDWAVTGFDADARTALLMRLAEALDATATSGELDAVVAESPSSAGLLRIGASGSDRISFELKPPMNARKLVELFGWKEAIGVSRGVHMDHWTIVEVVGVDEYRLETRAPQRGRWSIEATIGGWPTGGARPECRAGGIGQHWLGADDIVRSLSFTVRTGP